MFKIGDKVKPKNPKWRHGEGKVIRINNIGDWVCVRYNVSVCVLCSDSEVCSHPVTSKWYKSAWIELAVIPYEQLVFDFMMP